MLKVRQRGQAGLAEKNDILITIEPGEPGIGLDIVVKSPVFCEFGRHITETVENVLKDHRIEDAIVLVDDKGALDFTIRARCETALRRSLME